jgi:hypothetical protein
VEQGEEARMSAFSQPAAEVFGRQNEIFERSKLLPTNANQSSAIVGPPTADA